MTADDTTPDTGQDSIDLERESYPLREMASADLAETVEREGEQVQSAVDGVCRALVDDGEPLTDEKVQRLWATAGALVALSRTLSLRVPAKYRLGESGDRQPDLSTDAD